MKTKLTLITIMLTLNSLSGYAQNYSDGTKQNDNNYSTPSEQLKSRSSLAVVSHQIPTPVSLVLDIAYDGSNLWIAGYGESFIYKISPVDGSIIKTITSNGINAPRGLTFDGRHLFVIDSDNNIIYKMDTINGSIIDSFSSFSSSGSNSPAGLGWDGLYLWQTENFGNNFHLYKLDTLGNLISSYPQTFGASGLAFAQNSIWESDNSNDIIYETDASSFSVIQSFNAPGGTYPNGLAFDGQYLWLADGDKDSIYQIDVGYTTGIANHTLANSLDFLIYPNPATDFISIKVDNYYLGASYSITDINGKQISNGKLKKEITSIDIRQFPTGVYLLQAAGQERQTFKVIKK